MNKQIQTMITLSAGTLLLSSVASADLQGVSMDSMDSGFDGLTTYRLYLDVDSGDQVDAIFGSADDPLWISPTSGSFYQHELGSHRPPSEALFGFFSSLEYDSFVTIGLLNDTDDAMLDIGIDWTDFESNGGSIEADNGTWFATPEDSQVFEVDGRVLIAQFTTEDLNSSEKFGEINVLGKNADLTSWQYLNVPLPAPGAIAILGIAGYFVIRRRQ
jgi:hypothetical protein